jgi:hypothetical protein
MDSNHAATADNQDRAVSTRHGRHGRRQPAFSANTWRNGSDSDSAAASLSRRQDARSYDRLYDSSGDQTQRSYGESREPFYGAARNGDQYDSGYRSDSRRYRRDAGSRSRSRVITREQPSDQSLDARQQRSEPFWGGGFFTRGYGDND